MYRIAQNIGGRKLWRIWRNSSYWSSSVKHAVAKLSNMLEVNRYPSYQIWEVNASSPMASAISFYSLVYIISKAGIFIYVALVHLMCTSYLCGLSNKAHSEFLSRKCCISHSFYSKRHFS